MEIRILRRQGLGLRAIAQQMGVAVNTVRKYLADEEAPRYKARAPRAGKLEAFNPYLIERPRQRDGQSIRKQALDR